MPRARVAFAATALLAASLSGAGAQMILQGPAPGASGPTYGPATGPTGPAPSTQGPVMGPAPMMSGPMMGGPTMGAPQQQPPCMAEFMPLRSEAEKRANVLKAAIAHKVEREKLCPLFRSFSEAEEKVVKYAVSHEAKCQIPAQAVADMKKNHNKTAEVTGKVCSADAVKPAGPNLGEALGTTSLPTPDTTRSGGGTFDTLEGNPLRR